LLITNYELRIVNYELGITSSYSLDNNPCLCKEAGIFLGITIRYLVALFR
jgi:hypothetical protein